MVYYKSLFVVLAAVSTIVASPCKPSTTSPVLSTTTIEEPSGTSTSSVGDTTIVEPTITIPDDTTTVATVTTTKADISSTTSPTTTTATTEVDDTTTTTTEADITTTFAPTTITITTEVDSTTTTTAAETTSAEPCTSCGINRYFAEGNTLQFLSSPGTKDSAKDCLEACAAYDGCEVIDYYSQTGVGHPKGTCEFFKGHVETDGSPTPYQWYQVCCLANM